MVCDTGYAGVGAVLINFPHFSVLDYEFDRPIVETARFPSFDVRLHVGRLKYGQTFRVHPVAFLFG